jgi:hypothetical protein
MIYVLMIKSFMLGWMIVPIENNPYSTLYACTITRNMIIKHNVFLLDKNNSLHGISCVQRKKNYLNIEKENK